MYTVSSIHSTVLEKLFGTWKVLQFINVMETYILGIQGKC